MNTLRSACQNTYPLGLENVKVGWLVELFSSWLAFICSHISCFTFIFSLVFCVSSLNRFPDHFILATEACADPQTSKPPRVSLGDWSRGNQYSHSIIEVFDKQCHTVMLVMEVSSVAKIPKVKIPSKLSNKSDKYNSGSNSLGKTSI